MSIGVQHGAKGLSLDLTVVIPALNEESNLQSLLPDLARVLARMPIRAEVVVVDGGSGEDTEPLVERLGARFVRQASRGYGGAIAEGFAAARGEYILTMDADYSHEPGLIPALWVGRDESDLLVASRYVTGGSAESGMFRSLLSRVLNGVYRRFLRVPIRDLSSGFRLYRVTALERVAAKGRDFDFLPEVLVLLYAAGLRVREVPFHYRPRRDGRSRVKLFRFGWAYLTTLLRMRCLRRLASGTVVAGSSARGRRFDGLREGSEVP